MRWRKLGHVFAPSGEAAWARSHASFPTALALGDDRIRVYYTSLDADRYGRIGCVEVSAADPRRVLWVAPEPVLELGPLGAFDDSGVNASSVVVVGGRWLLYYIGWQRAARVPYMMFTGLAESVDEGRSFRRLRRVPILDRTDAEPFSRSAACVRLAGERFRCWYWSCRGWSHDGRAVHYNNVIRYAESPDGVAWTPAERAVLAPGEPDAYSLGRPWVIVDADRHRMWYAIRSHDRPYRVGYAESPDGLVWQPLDHEVAPERSAGGWDSEMVCFACVVDARGRRLMFYNGNGHGATGFGVAELQSD